MVKHVKFVCDVMLVLTIRVLLNSLRNYLNLHVYTCAQIYGLKKFSYTSST
jgi:hypothetical protein